MKGVKLTANRRGGPLPQDKEARKLEIARRNRLYYRAVRRAVIEYYGGCCSCCGEKTFEFLALDHINGGGVKHRKEIKTANLSDWLRRNNFPDGFRILCHNCNMARGHWGKCPHEL